jgi:O-methyltransferase
MLFVVHSSVIAAAHHPSPLHLQLSPAQMYLAMLFFLVFVPLCATHRNRLLAPPREWIEELEALNAMPIDGEPVDVAAAYLNVLSSILTSSGMVCDPSVEDKLLSCLHPFQFGTSWPKVGVTMAGHKRLMNIKEMLLRANTSGVSGGYLEAGVWRGGMSIFATAVVEAFNFDRKVYLCDSFEGLPLPRAGSLRADETMYQNTLNKALSMGTSHVADNFHMYGVPTRRVQFVKGFFVDSLPGLRKQLIANNERISVLRLDGDMYDSTIDILYNLFDLVSIGGYIVIDDFGWEHATRPGERSLWGAKDAVLDFRAKHGIDDLQHVMHNIDGYGAWFQKQREVHRMREHYLHCVNTSDYQGLRPRPRLTTEDYLHLMLKWDRASV